MNGHPLISLFLLSTGTFLIAFAISFISRLSAARRHLVWQVSFAVVAICSPILLLGVQIAVPVLRSTPEESRLRAGETTVVQPETPNAGSARGAAMSSVPTKAPVLPCGRLIWSVWAVGAFVSVLRLMLRYRTLKGVMRQARLIGFTSPAGELLTESKSGLPVYASREVDTPMAIGIRSSVILIPDSLLNESEQRLQAVLLHEMAHVRNSDVRMLLLVGVTTAIHWFNPLAWAGSARFKACAELAADDEAVKCSETPEDYAESLLAIVRRLKIADARVFPAVQMAGCSNVRQRISRMLDKSLDRSVPSSSTRRLAFILVIGFGLAGFVVRPVAAQQSSNDRKSTGEAQKLEQVSSTPNPPKEVPMIEVTLELMEVTAEAYSRNKELFDQALVPSSEESCQRLIRSLEKLPGVTLISAPKVITKSRQKATVSIEQSRHTVDADDAGVPKNPEANIPDITFEVEPQLVNDIVEVVGYVKIEKFLGFADNDPKSPLVYHCENRFNLKLEPGKSIVIPAAYQARENKVAGKVAKSSESKTEESEDPRWFFLLKASPVR